MTATWRGEAPAPGSAHTVLLSGGGGPGWCGGFRQFPEWSAPGSQVGTWRRMEREGAGAKGLGG